MFCLVGENASFEISPEWRLGSESCACEIGRCDKGGFPVHNDRLGVDSRAEDSLEEIATDEIRIFIEILTESGARLLGVEELDGDTFLDEIVEN